MKNQKLLKQLDLTHEQTSPLFRVMFTQNSHEPNRRHFENNICAFHIGNGYILSVAHNLKTEAKIFKSIDETIFTNDILPNLNEAQKQLFLNCFLLDQTVQKRYWNSSNPSDYQFAIEALKQINFDTRWVTFLQKKICRAHLIVQFKDRHFYNKPELSAHFSSADYFAEPAINRHTYLVEVELIEAFYSDDIALYRMVNTPSEVIDAMPSIAIDYTVLSDEQAQYYCLQSSPTSEVGKLLNKAQIEGFTEHFAIFPERVGGNYILEGLRYLIKGYFRFGSSGAPYLVYDELQNEFKVNAIQSEACPIQLSIDHKRDGNFQYVNALATPLHNIKERLEFYLNQ
ncbi:hypothetical protein IVB69_11565 [Flavobacterium sp. J49]|uniref:hypothetical protein n=1 Tax=Flavobacterium sp. J49 TaxID=2718534 RepID=UPI001592F5D3|nr:hypothetical protein [Flavobacterium sp. J49]MBF6642121.1 hypothetical protein [Flavobacterium sp. J49]NIC03368.1 hypothetical protein [Flavobacterium sp. J49]